MKNIILFVIKVCRKGDIKSVKFLFNNKASLSIKNGDGETSLHYGN